MKTLKEFKELSEARGIAAFQAGGGDGNGKIIMTEYAMGSGKGQGVQVSNAGKFVRLDKRGAELVGKMLTKWSAQTLKEFNESRFNMEQVANLKEFEGAGQATDYFESIQRYLNSKALMDWAKATGSTSVRELKTARASFDKFVQSMYDAD